MLKGQRLTVGKAGDYSEVAKKSKKNSAALQL